MQGETSELSTIDNKRIANHEKNQSQTIPLKDLLRSDSSPREDEGQQTDGMAGLSSSKGLEMATIEGSPSNKHDRDMVGIDMLYSELYKQ